MKYAFTNCIILNGKKDMEPLTGYSIIVKDGKIENITNEKIEGIKIIDLKHKYVLPGLINMHVHLPGSGMPKDTSKQNKESVNKLLSHKFTRYIVYKLCANFAKTELLSGVTTIRTVGGLSNIDSKIRDNINKGKLKGPRILASNMALSVPNGHMAGVLAYEATDVDSAIKYIDKISETKPDLIKLMITGGVLDAKKKGEPGELKMSPEIINAASKRAHELGYKVAAHVESPLGVKLALENGVDTIEHGAKLDDDIIKLFKERNASLITTISPAIPLAKFDRSVTRATELTQYNGNIVFEGIVSASKSCIENNIMVGLGTDTACPFVTHYNTWRELAYFSKYVKADNKEAIYHATLQNAIIAGIDKVTGSIEVNKSCDLLIVDKNPLDDLSNLRKPSMVIFRGKIIKNPKVKKFKYVEEELDKHLYD
ncbi:MAG: amidohydrolase family protein [Acholeplasmataceae bacterium]|nr:amidohydrolase family protein [Acholeplasmataceae bacterium]